MVDLSVVIVSFNTRDKLRSCLQSVFGSKTNFSFEVLVVDNASSDGSAEMVRIEFPQVKFIQNRENLGFAKANNQAIRQSHGLYILLLNSDIEVDKDTFEKMIEFVNADPAIGIAGCQVVKSDGSLDPACRRSFPNLANAFFRLSGLSLLFPKTRLASYNLSFLPEDLTTEVDSVMGAFLLIRRLVVAKIGFLDEQFFMYGGDLDWCWRTKEAGYKVIYAPVTRVIHHKGSSSSKTPQKALYEFHRAMQLFYDKHYKMRYNVLVSALVTLGIWLRYAWKRFQNSLRGQKYVS